MISSSLARVALTLALGIAVAVPASAQTDETAPAAVPPDRERTVYDGDYFTIGAGVGVGPSYEGSDDYVIFPAVAFQGQLGGVTINPRPFGLALDFIDDPADARVSFALGPVVRVRRERTSNIVDPVVARLGRLGTAVEVGAAAGITLNRPLTGYDTLTATLDLRRDVAGAHDGTVIAPSLSYFTPVSRGAAVVLAVGAEHVDDSYADYYYSVTPTGSALSGLPVYRARGGWKNLSLSALGAVDLNGNLADGGFALFVGGNYSRLLGNFADAPIVSMRGSAGQFTAAIGVGYTF